MGFYYGIFIILVLFSCVEIMGLKRSSQLLIFFGISLFFFILSFFRWENGTDWVVYQYVFENTKDLNDPQFEIGYSLLSYYIKLIFDNYSVLLFILGCILFYFQTLAIRRLSIFPIITMLFLWSISFGNIFFVRQGVALSILLFSIQYIIDKNVFKFAICILLAMTFHISSFIFVLAWFVYRKNIKTIWMILLVVLSIVLTPYIKILMENSLGGFNSMFADKLDFYLSEGTDNMYGSELSLNEIMIKGALSKGLLFTVLLFYRDKISKDIIYFNGLLNIYWIGIIIYFSLIGIALPLARFSYAFDMIQIILFPMVFKYIDKKYQIFFMLLFSCYLAARLYSAIYSYYDLFVPYKTFLF